MKNEIRCSAGRDVLGKPRGLFQALLQDSSRQPEEKHVDSLRVDVIITEVVLLGTFHVADMLTGKET
jgi:hypothetical protein